MASEWNKVVASNVARMSELGTLNVELPQSDWLKLLIRHNVLEDQTAFLSSVREGQVRFPLKANLLRWVLHSVRTAGDEDLRRKFTSKALCQRINSQPLRSADYGRLVQLMHDLKLNERVAKLPNEMGVLSSRSVDNFMGARGSRLPDDVVYAIGLQLLDANVLKTNEKPVHTESPVLAKLLSALQDFLDVSADTRRNLATAASGNYFLYRPSSHAPGLIVRGLVKIAEAKATKESWSPTLVVDEIYVHRGAKGLSRDFEENYVGVMTLKAGCGFMMTCRQSDASRPGEVMRISRGAPRVSLLPLMSFDDSDGNGHQEGTSDDGRTKTGPKPVERPARIATMTGLSVATFAGGQASCLPVCLVRIDESVLGNEKEMRRKLGVFEPTAPGAAVGPSDIPLDVQRRLQHAMPFNWTDAFVKAWQ